ncbi:MAG: hypothetical protein O7C61_10245 [SAR324 cluster bacterium]|nr:hypothetical protein [SAR324 cluster bacterium]
MNAKLILPLLCMALLAAAGCREMDGSFLAQGGEQSRQAAVTDNNSVSGSWSGWIEDPEAGSSSFEMDLEQQGQRVEGAYYSEFSTGSVSGVVNDSSGVLFFHPESSGDCPILATFRMGDGMAVGETDVSCELTPGGSFAIAKQ